MGESVLFLIELINSETQLNCPLSCTNKVFLLKPGYPHALSFLKFSSLKIDPPENTSKFSFGYDLQPLHAERYENFHEAKH